MMSRVKMGMVSGLSGALAVAALEAVNMALGPWAVPFPRMVAVMLQVPDLAVAGWVGHFVVGTLLLGPLFGMFAARLPTDTPETKGIVFAVGAFLVMMLTVAPLSGVGMLGARAGLTGVLWMLGGHIVFGLVMGNVYGRLESRQKRLARMHPPEGVAAR
ncbi:MAG: DUF6789 family protein [Brevundimonas sp.]|uniref:DUF6789 family protein n=1 Tax=Brevundimonas sp. TaxID=1871086 RepID=UPI0022C5220B|nr:DUF6789 family protein [Brevundimonas sp.]MCZ8194480.1 hypothetical protein [Brevundimonas sp.]